MQMYIISTTFLVLLIFNPVITGQLYSGMLAPTTGSTNTGITSPQKYTLSKKNDELIIRPGENANILCPGKDLTSWKSKPANLTVQKATKLQNNKPVENSINYIQYNNERLQATFNDNQSTLILKNAQLEDTGTYICQQNETDLLFLKLYVFDPDKCQLLVSYTHNGPFYTLQYTAGENIVLPCRKTHPLVNISLHHDELDDQSVTYIPEEGFSLGDATIKNNQKIWTCTARKSSCKEDEIKFLVIVNEKESIKSLHIIRPQSRSLLKCVSDDVQLQCQVQGTFSAAGKVEWRINDNSINYVELMRFEWNIIPDVSTNNGVDTTIFTLSINNLQKDDSGNYSCVSNSDGLSDKIHLQVFSGHNLEFENKPTIIKQNLTGNEDSVKWILKFQACPQKITSFEWFGPNNQLVQNNTKAIARGERKYEKIVNFDDNSIKLVIYNLSPQDAGTYRVKGQVGAIQKTANLTLILNYVPIVKIITVNGFLLAGKSEEFLCHVESDPKSSIDWIFQPCKNSSDCNKKLQDNDTVGLQINALESTTLTSSKATVTYKFLSNNTGIITCKACNVIGCSEDKQIVVVTDVPKGYSVVSTPESKEVTYDDTLWLQCLVSKYNCSNKCSWITPQSGTYIPNINSRSNMKERITIHQSQSEYSYSNNLTIWNVTKLDDGSYTCKCECDDGKTRHWTYLLRAQQATKPTFPKDVEKPKPKEGDPLKLNCSTSSLPRPVIQWYKDGAKFKLENSGNNSAMRVSMKNNNAILDFAHVVSADDGEYMCNVQNRVGKDTRIFYLDVQGPNKTKKSVAAYIVPIIIICVALLLVVIYLARRVKREKSKVRSLTAQDVRIFLEGAIDEIDPDLGLDQQADLLPYNTDYEFPREKLKLGRQLGSGAFGRVVKAEAEGPLFGADQTAFEFGYVSDQATNNSITIVAVKMVKPHAEVAQVKALMTELKILIHVGKHLNVVNLLGACTTNLVKKELLVIVEYCRFGNIHSLLLRQRDDFVDQIDHLRDVIDFSIGAETDPGRYQNILLENRQVLFTEDKTVVFTPEPYSPDSINPGSETPTLDSSGAMSEHWTPKYRGDFKTHEIPHISTKDLVCWSYQVARGMEYLSTRQVVHADLAARNLLLAENNVVKICDFGLARNLYKDANYFKKSDDPLPVKWMAVESIRDRVFSSQSDVWSFGIVLWELFTLAKTPYPGIPLDENFLPKLQDGYRMEKPKMSTLKIYRIMKSCWEEKPSERPTFSDLVTTFGQILDDNVKQRYLQMNGPYIRMNSIQQDYQNMVRASKMSMKPEAGHEKNAGNDSQMPRTSAQNYEIPRVSKYEGSVPVLLLNTPDVPADDSKTGTLIELDSPSKPSNEQGYINFNADIEHENPTSSVVYNDDPPPGYLRMSPIQFKS